MDTFVLHVCLSCTSLLRQREYFDGVFCFSSSHSSPCSMTPLYCGLPDHSFADKVFGLMTRKEIRCATESDERTPGNRTSYLKTGSPGVGDCCDSLFSNQNAYQVRTSVLPTRPAPHHRQTIACRRVVAVR